MRRYVIEVNGQEHVIDVDELSADTFQVTVGGQQVQVRLADHDDLAGAVIAPHIEPTQRPAAPLPAAPPNSAAQVNPVRVMPVPAQTPASTPSAAPRGGAGGANSMTAPMPGVILSVSTQVGAEVKRGDVLLVLEAMKMKNALQAARDGRIAEIYVTEKQQVKYGDALLRFEEG